jgi:hypothetical protein
MSIRRSSISVGFFLGAGVSLPTAPMTAALTQRIVDGNDRYFLHTDEDWYPRSAKTPAINLDKQQRATNVQGVISQFRQLVERYYIAREEPAGCVVRQCTYEDIAYLADSVANTLSRERDDPGLLPLVEYLRAQLGWSVETVQKAADDALRFIRAVVYQELASLHPPNNHLRVLQEVIADPKVLQVPIYTLNHDCLIEDVLATSKVTIHDFLRRDQSKRWILKVGNKVPRDARAVIYKLHGSVRWRRFRPLESNNQDPWLHEWIGGDCDTAGARHDDGNVWRSNGGPLILVGRFNKELSYLDAPYWHLFAEFERSLAKQRNIVISGYSFGDKAINAMLINWVYATPKRGRRLIVLHADEAMLMNGARGAIRSKWNNWRAQSLVRVIPHFLGDSSWAQIKRELTQ